MSKLKSIIVDIRLKTPPGEYPFVAFKAALDDGKDYTIADRFDGPIDRQIVEDRTWTAFARRAWELFGGNHYGVNPKRDKFLLDFRSRLRFNWKFNPETGI